MRIIAGTFKGRRLRSPSGLGTRPTTDRVREALFNVLGNVVQGASVLDCYAGSGALGLEALSRGARSATFVEKASPAIAVLQANLAALGLSDTTQVQVVRSPLERSRGRLLSLGPFDLWLVDPPFAYVREGSIAGVLATLMEGGLLAPEGLVVLEYPSDQPTPSIEGLLSEEIRRYGDSHLAFYRPSAEARRS